MSIYCVGTVRVWRTCIMTFYAMRQAHIYCQSVHMKMMPLHQDGWCCYDKLSRMNPSSFTWQHRLDNFSTCLTTSSLSSSLVEDLIFVNCHCAVITHSLYLSLTFTHSFYFPYLHHLFRPSLVSLFFFLAIILHSCPILFSFPLFFFLPPSRPPLSPQHYTVTTATTTETETGAVIGPTQTPLLGPGPGQGRGRDQGVDGTSILITPLVPPIPLQYLSAVWAHTIITIMANISTIVSILHIFCVSFSVSFSVSF